eukprot:m.62777 g.62777  ORF g.62777 m.62777 type:complete len:155 (+) comp7419_c0_seq3:861-1325(+)
MPQQRRQQCRAAKRVRQHRSTELMKRTLAAPVSWRVASARKSRASQRSDSALAFLARLPHMQPSGSNGKQLCQSSAFLLAAGSGCTRAPAAHEGCCAKRGHALCQQGSTIDESMSGVFCGHTWSLDDMGRDNHKRVVAVAKALQQRGIPAWIDE